MNWREFFTNAQDYQVSSRFYECEYPFTLEELYQAFKARMESERLEAEENSGP